MCLIFDRFASESDAHAFVARVQEIRPGRQCWVFLNQQEADENDPFPFHLNPPIVHVDRLVDCPASDEPEIIELVTSFDGTYAGT